MPTEGRQRIKDYIIDMIELEAKYLSDNARIFSGELDYSQDGDWEAVLLNGVDSLQRLADKLRKLRKIDDTR